MNIEIAEGIGFCFGVKRAIRMAQEALEKNNATQVYSLGHIIHNNQVVEELLKEGLRPVQNLDGIDRGVVVISSHGASPEIMQQIKAKGLELVDATCPYVTSAQNIVKSLGKDGYSIVILGDSRHPEVKSLCGFADGRAAVIRDEGDVEKTELPSKRIGVVSQTTQSPENYYRVICAICKKEFQEIRAYNTICNDTHVRQQAAAKLARNADVMIIVGGRNSANTKRLYEICSGICADSYHIETADELRKEWFGRKCHVGITSGASTPEEIIKSVKNFIHKEGGMK